MPQLRRGLPRVPGGEPWPPLIDDPTTPTTCAPAEPVAAPATVSASSPTTGLRQGLPRTPGGEPWPPATAVAAFAGAAGAAAAPSTATPSEPGAAATSTADAADQATAPAATPANTVEVPLRRGLPRVAGGEAWPPAGTVHVPAPAEPEAAPAPAPTAAPAAATTADATPTPEPDSAPAAPAAPTPAAPAPVEVPAGRGVVDKRWLIPALVLVIAAFVGARWFIGTDTGADFVARYDGMQPLPDNAPVGFPAWLNWAHFFNMFLMALIVKTGLDVRREKRPAGYWTSKRNGKKISLTQWLHQTLDIAWVALGVVFYILLFATGQWVRIVPTSIDVIPNAISAGLQYLALDWPDEHGWVHYNALQELAYFTTVFIASPLAIASGFRMSSMWPKTWNGVPVAWARAVHFPTMIYFLIFMVIHVFLVATTGLRANLNAMFAAQDSTSWTGTLVFLGAVAVTALGWFLARGSFAAPLAKLTGKVTKR